MKKTIITLIALITIMAGCGNTRQDESRQLTIATSIEPQSYFIKRIAGDKAEIKTLLPKGTKPETYDLTPNQIVELGKCNAYFTMGHLPFERAWVDKYSNSHPHTNLIDMSHGITPIITDHAHGQPSGQNSQNIFVEPHTWMSVNNAFIIANNVCDGLCIADPANKDYYRQRLDTLENELRELDKAIRAKLSDADSTFLIYHPALSYFARDYGLTQISVERDGKEPSPREMKHIIDRAAHDDIHVMFIQPEFDHRSARTLVQSTSTQLVDINPLARDWKAEMLHIADALANAKHKKQ